MESAVRSPWIKSAITTGRARNDALLASQDSQNSRQPTGIGRQNPAAGNGIFGCRDGRLKIGLRDRKGHRRPKEWNDTERKSPQKRPIGSRRRDLRFRRTGWWRRSGSNCLLPTQGSNPSPKLESGTEFFAAETGRRNGLIRLDCRSRDRANQNIWQTCL
jgi:hypothetical protein